MTENVLSGASNQESIATEEIPVEESTEETPVEETEQQDEETGPTDAEPEVETEQQLQARLAELKRAKEEAEREAKYWAQQKRQQRDSFFKDRSQEPAPKAERTPAAAELTAAPNEDDFDTYEEYRDALEDYKIQKAIIDYDNRVRSEQARAKIDTFAADLVADGMKKYADFNQVATAEGNPTLPITPMMIEAFREFEAPADIAYYLGKNPVECQAISRMSPVQMARALTKIEGKVLAAHQAAPQRKISNAPPPIKPTGSGNVVGKDPNKMTQAEYEEWRRSGGT